MQLKIYSVAPGQTNKLAEALGNALGKSANITSPAPGKLLVYAPEQAQDSIATTLASLGKASSDGKPSAQMDVHFWIVDALPGAGSDDTALKTLTPALSALEKDLGPLHFQLVQAVSAIASVGDQPVSIGTMPGSGSLSQFDFTIQSVSGNTNSLWLNYMDAGKVGLAMFKSRISIQSGQYVVLAQAPGACAVASLIAPAPPCPVKPLLRLLVVRVDRLPPQA